MHINDSQITALGELWRSADLEPEIANTLDDAVTRYELVRSTYLKFKNNPALTSELGERVARGEIEFDTAVATHASTRNTEAAQSVYDAARRALKSEMATYLRSFGDEILTEHLGPREADIFADVEKHARVLGDVATPAEAFAGGAKTTAAWHALDEAAATCEILSKIYGTFRQNGLLHSEWLRPEIEERPVIDPATVNRAVADSMYVGGSARTVRPKSVHKVRRFADLVLSGAGPRTLATASTPRGAA